jgi:hypothetical protein
MTASALSVNNKDNTEKSDLLHSRAQYLAAMRVSMQKE